MRRTPGGDLLPGVVPSLVHDGTGALGNTIQRFLDVQTFGQNLGHGGADIGVDLAPDGDDRTPVGVSVFQRFTKGGGEGKLLVQARILIGREARRVAAVHRHHQVTLFRGQPLHQKERRLFVLGVLGNADAKAAGLAAATHAHRVHGIADLAHDARPIRVFKPGHKGDGIKEHGRLPTGKRVGRFGRTKGQGPFGAAIYDGFQRIGGFYASGIVDDRVPRVVKDATAQRGKVQQERMRRLVARGRARRHTAHAGLKLWNGAGRVQQLLIGLRLGNAVLFKDVLAVGQNRCLGPERNTIKRTGRTGQIALGAASHADVLDIAVDQVIRVIGRVGQFGVHEKLGEVFQLIRIDIIRLGEHNVGDQVIFALVLRQFQRLAFAHLEVRQLVHLDLDARLFGELRQRLDRRIIVRVRGKVHDQRGAFVFRVRVRKKRGCRHGKPRNRARQAVFHHLHYSFLPVVLSFKVSDRWCGQKA
mmetsp:Transcript_18172/g.28428  ORF Transcript_18172/g.28428 Transcript_18172/m.28428 type:complete len:473 (-) Transcript_18172:67-1485(-)